MFKSQLPTDNGLLQTLQLSSVKSEKKNSFACNPPLNKELNLNN